MTSPVQVVLTVSKPGEKGDVPVGVIVGSVIAGLLLLALAVGLLWKVRVCLHLSAFMEMCSFMSIDSEENLICLSTNY